MFNLLDYPYDVLCVDILHCPFCVLSFDVSVHIFIHYQVKLILLILLKLILQFLNIVIQPWQYDIFMIFSLPKWIEFLKYHVSYSL